MANRNSKPLEERWHGLSACFPPTRFTPGERLCLQVGYHEGARQILDILFQNMRRARAGKRRINPAVVEETVIAIRAVYAELREHDNDMDRATGLPTAGLQ